MKPRRLWIFLSALLPLLFLTAYAGARAGGGGGFHGGGGGGGGHGGGGGFGGGDGGGGGGDGDGGFIFWIIWFCIVHPVLGVPLLILIAFVYFKYLKGNSFSASTTPPPAPVRFEESRSDPIGTIMLNDPAFDPDAFCNRVGAGFMKLQAAWCDQNLKDVRPFISDGIHERFSLQFAEQKGDGVRDHMDGTGIDQISIVDANADEIYDEVALRIVAHAADYQVSMRDGKPVHGKAPMEQFVEVWSFLRRRGVSTVPGKTGLLEGNCPNCGAPIELNESANCKNCNALLRSGQYDWVLSEITQATEWHPGGHAAVPGLAQLRQRDPEVNVQELEDRASVVFWRKAAADRIGKLDPMFKVTSPAFGQTYLAHMKPQPGQPRTYFGQCAVGSVAVRGFVSGNDLDLAVVEIHWEAQKMAVQPDRTSKQVSERAIHRTLFVLMRNSSAKTDVAKGISSAHCPSCGAPESGGVNGACEFCGAALNDGSNGWVLDNVLGFADQQAQALLRQLNVGHRI